MATACSLIFCSFRISFLWASLCRSRVTSSFNFAIHSRKADSISLVMSLSRKTSAHRFQKLGNSRPRGPNTSISLTSKRSSMWPYRPPLSGVPAMCCYQLVWAACGPIWSSLEYTIFSSFEASSHWLMCPARRPSANKRERKCVVDGVLASHQESFRPTSA